MLQKTSFGQIKIRQRRLLCRDGISLSVQAGEHIYCSPRDNYGPYIQVEVGFINPISAIPDSWAEYADGGHPCDVYGYVPVELVEQFIQEHGGLNIGDLLADKRE